MRPALVVMALCSALMIAVVMRAGTFEEWSRPTTAGAEGYDGQFSLSIAVDPARSPDLIAAVCRDFWLPGYFYTPELHRQFARIWRCEMPGYRLQRILHAALAFVGKFAFGGGRDAALIALALVNVIMLGVGTWAVGELLRAERYSRWWALCYGLFPGLFFAARAVTTEPLAYGLAVLGIWAALNRKNLGLAGAFFALAALAKETTLFFPAGLAAYYALRREFRAAFGLMLMAVLPFVAWQFVIRAWVGTFGVGSGGAGSTSFELIPFNGLWRIPARQPADIAPVLFIYPVLTALIPTVWAFVTGLRRVWRGPLHPYTYLLLANAAIMPFVPVSTYETPFGIIRFLPGLAVCTLLYAAHFRNRRVMLYTTLWVALGGVFIG
jgi:hypothetical protein